MKLLACNCFSGSLPGDGGLWCDRQATPREGTSRRTCDSVHTTAAADSPRLR